MADPAVHVLLLPPTPGDFFDRQVVTPDGRVDCFPAAFAPVIDRCRQLFDEAVAETDGGGSARFRLIHKRDPWMHNTWLANVPRMKRGGRTTNPLGLYPDDELLPGVVSVVHGWGHDASPRMRVAAANPGVNPNVLLPIGPGSFEPLSSQAHMTGIPVTLDPV